MTSKHIKRNIYYTFVFTQADAASVYAACLHLQLDSRCQKMLGSLLPGQCIFRQTQASWSTAMWCRIDYVPPARDVAPIEYTRHPYVPAISLSDAPHVLEALDAAVEEHRKTAERQSQIQKADRDDRPMTLLGLAAANPFVPVVRLFEMLGHIRFEAQRDIRKVLEDSGLAVFEEPRIGRSNMLLMEVTDKGHQALGQPIPADNKGRGGVAHRHFAHWIQSHFEKSGQKAVLEWVVPGTTHPVDLAVQSGNSWDVFEVCVTACDNMLSHMEACFARPGPVRSLTVVAGTKMELKELQRSIQKESLFTVHAGQIRFEVIENYLL